jgi:hypothetical protein
MNVSNKKLWIGAFLALYGHQTIASVFQTVRPKSLGSLFKSAHNVTMCSPKGEPRGDVKACLEAHGYLVNRPGASNLVALDERQVLPSNLSFAPVECSPAARVAFHAFSGLCPLH